MRSSLATSARADQTAHIGPTSNTTRETPTDGRDAGALLYELLVKYVSLLEDDQHGGWTREEDDVVHDVIAALLSLGWDIRRPAR
jgi:hypothetical protein